MAINQTSEPRNTGKDENSLTRRRFLKRGAAGGALLAGMYVAPEFTSVKAGPAYATTVDTPTRNAYSISNGAVDQAVNPLATAQSGAGYYDFQLPGTVDSGFPAFGPQSHTGFFWLHENSNNGDISLGMIFDEAFHIDQGSIDFSLSGSPGSAFIALADLGVPGAGQSFGTAGADLSRNSDTAGGVIGGLGGAWEITLSLNSSSGLSNFYFLTGDPATPNQIALDLRDDLIISCSI